MKSRTLCIICQIKKYIYSAKSKQIIDESQNILKTEVLATQSIFSAAKKRTSSNLFNMLRHVVGLTAKNDLKSIKSKKERLYRRWMKESSYKRKAATPTSLISNKKLNFYTISEEDQTLSIINKSISKRAIEENTKKVKFTLTNSTDLKFDKFEEILTDSQGGIFSGLLAEGEHGNNYIKQIDKITLKVLDINNNDFKGVAQRNGNNLDIYLNSKIYSHLSNQAKEIVLKQLIAEYILTERENGKLYGENSSHKDHHIEHVMHSLGKQPTIIENKDPSYHPGPNEIKIRSPKGRPLITIARKVNDDAVNTFSPLQKHLKNSELNELLNAIDNKLNNFGSKGIEINNLELKRNELEKKKSKLEKQIKGNFLNKISSEEVLDLLNIKLKYTDGEIKKIEKQINEMYDDFGKELIQIISNNESFKSRRKNLASLAIINNHVSAYLNKLSDSTQESENLKKGDAKYHLREKMHNVMASLDKYIISEVSSKNDSYLASYKQMQKKSITENYIIQGHPEFIYERVVNPKAVNVKTYYIANGFSETSDTEASIRHIINNKKMEKIFLGVNITGLLFLFSHIAYGIGKIVHFEDKLMILGIGFKAYEFIGTLASFILVANIFTTFVGHKKAIEHTDLNEKKKTQYKALLGTFTVGAVLTTLSLNVLGIKYLHYSPVSTIAVIVAAVGGLITLASSLILISFCNKNGLKDEAKHFKADAIKIAVKLGYQALYAAGIKNIFVTLAYLGGVAIYFTKSLKPLYHHYKHLRHDRSILKALKEKKQAEENISKQGSVIKRFTEGTLNLKNCKLTKHKDLRTSSKAMLNAKLTTLDNKNMDVTVKNTSKYLSDKRQLSEKLDGLLIKMKDNFVVNGDLSYYKFDKKIDKIRKLLTTKNVLFEYYFDNEDLKDGLILATNSKYLEYNNILLNKDYCELIETIRDNEKRKNFKEIMIFQQLCDMVGIDNESMIGLSQDIFGEQAIDKYLIFRDKIAVPILNNEIVMPEENGKKILEESINTFLGLTEIQSFNYLDNNVLLNVFKQTLEVTKDFHINNKILSDMISYEDLLNVNDNFREQYMTTIFKTIDVDRGYGNKLSPLEIDQLLKPKQTADTVLEAA